MLIDPTRPRKRAIQQESSLSISFLPLHYVSLHHLKEGNPIIFQLFQVASILEPGWTEWASEIEAAAVAAAKGKREKRLIVRSIVQRPNSCVYKRDHGMLFHSYYYTEKKKKLPFLPGFDPNETLSLSLLVIFACSLQEQERGDNSNKG